MTTTGMAFVNLMFNRSPTMSDQSDGNLVEEIVTTMMRMRFRVLRSVTVVETLGWLL